MDKKRAKEILLAHACCSLSNSCDDCPWNNMYDCEITKFDEETIKKAIKIVKGSNMKMMKLQDIKLTSAFTESVPSEKKMNECRYYWDNYHKQDRYLVINRDGYLIDGYVMYCVLKENNIGEANVKISARRKKRWFRKNVSDWDSPHYRNEETTYVYGMHYNTIRGEFSKEFVWRVPRLWSEKGWEDGLKTGDEILVDTKYGIKKIAVTRVEKLDKCPVDFPVKRVVKRLDVFKVD